MRNFLASKFICTKCGDQLNASYDIPKLHENSNDSIAGAQKVEMFIAVDPCKTCLAPLNEIINAIKVLTKLSK